MLKPDWKEFSTPSYNAGPISVLKVLGLEINIIPYRDKPGEPVKGSRVMVHEPGLQEPTMLAECVLSKEEGRKIAEAWVLDQIKKVLLPGSLLAPA